MKANKLLIMVLLIGSSFLMSCMMPMVCNYYSPEAEGGTAIKSMCGGSVGPEDKMEFSIDGVTIRDFHKV